MGVYCVRSGVGVCGGLLCEEWSWSVWGYRNGVGVCGGYCVKSEVGVYCVRNVKLECVWDIICVYEEWNWSVWGCTV